MNAARPPEGARPPVAVRGTPLVVALGCVFLFAGLVSQLLSDGPLVALDHAITDWLARRRAGWVTGLTLFVSLAHQTVAVLVVTALLAAWVARRGRRSDAWALQVVPAGMLVNWGLKHLFARARPEVDEPIVQIATYSFPSGHAAASTLFYGSLAFLLFARTRGRRRRALGLAACAAMVLLVCFSRVYLGVHYFSDVLAGISVGLLCLVIAFRPGAR